MPNFVVGTLDLPGVSSTAISRWPLTLASASYGNKSVKDNHPSIKIAYSSFHDGGEPDLTTQHSILAPLVICNTRHKFGIRFFFFRRRQDRKTCCLDSRLGSVGVDDDDLTIAVLVGFLDILLLGVLFLVILFLALGLSLAFGGLGLGLVIDGFVLEVAELSAQLGAQSVGVGVDVGVFIGWRVTIRLSPDQVVSSL